MNNNEAASPLSVPTVASTGALGGASDGALGGTLGGVLGAWLLLGACVSGVKVGGSDAEMASWEKPPILGSTTQAEILAENPAWVDDLVRAQPDPAQAQRLADPAPDMEVVVFFGTWCSDSRRELTRLWRAVEMAGGDFGFPIRYVGVDRTKTEPGDLLEGVELLYVPTLIVSKNGLESGRIIESAPGGIERDLVALLAGETSGWLSGRDDLGADLGAGLGAGPVSAATP